MLGDAFLCLGKEIFQMKIEVSRSHSSATEYVKTQYGAVLSYRCISGKGGVDDFDESQAVGLTNGSRSDNGTLKLTIFHKKMPLTPQSKGNPSKHVQYLSFRNRIFWFVQERNV